jgi:hypothetical protein
MVARFRLLSLPALVVSLMPLLATPAAMAEPPAAAAGRCTIATLKGTYLYSSIGTLDGKPYAESGREVYDGQGGIVLTFRGSDGASGTVRASYSVTPDCIGKAVYPDGQSAVSFISPDGSRFSYTITRAPGDRRTSLSGWEIRVAP